MDAGFWPTTLQGWLAVAGFLATAIVSIVGAVWASVRQPIMAKVNGLGKRVTDQEHISQRLTGRMESAERAIDLAQVDSSNLHESISRLSTEMQTLTNLTRTVQMERLEDMSEIKERLARIETKVSGRRHRNSGDDR